MTRVLHLPVGSGPVSPQAAEPAERGALDFERRQLLDQLPCNRCGAVDGRQHRLDEVPYRPVEEGPPWLCDLDRGEPSFVAVLCPGCLAALRRWIYGTPW